MKIALDKRLNPNYFKGENPKKKKTGQKPEVGKKQNETVLFTPSS